MIKDKSWARKQYDRCYSHMRRGLTFEQVYNYLCQDATITRAADYSYQAANYEVHGWSNNCRRARFHAIKYRSFAFPEDIPF